MPIATAILRFSNPLPGGWPKLALGVALLLGMFAQIAAAQNIDARVLHINSYHRGYSWSDGIEQGLRDRFAASGKNIEISVEYLDSRRFTYGAQIEPLAAAMAIKYASYRPDLVVVSDNAAFDFAIRNRQRLFPGLPIVFCGYNNFRPEVIQGIANITGVNEEISIDNTVDMALKVHPATRTLVFVTSTGEASSKRISEIAEAAVFPKYRNRFNLVVLKDASLAEIRERLAQLPRDSLVFLSGQTRDPGAGRELTPVENGRLISAASPLPVYTFWDFHLGTGVLGGHILTGPDQGRTAADLALRILGGTRADDIPVVMTSPTSDIFDYPVMQRFHIEPDALPPNSVILNRPVTLWETYRWQIAATLFLLVIETLLILSLVRAMRQRKQALAALKLEQEQLERKVEERTRELHASETRLKHLNETLDQRVKEEVAKNLAQEKLLIQQSRQAAMGQMIGNIAHQWRQPLNTLGLLLENLKDANEYGELDSATIDTSVTTGRQLIQTMATTIDDFRNFFKPNKEKTSFDLGYAIEKTRNILGDTLQNRNNEVSVAPAPEIWVNGYPNELTQVLLNVVNNAGDALLEKQVAGGKIEITRGCDGDTAWIAVTDNAGGIPAEILPKIFDPYFTTKASGTGIGLYMSRMIMEHMDGTITARNLGEGMEFRITLPAQ